MISMVITVYGSERYLAPLSSCVLSFNQRSYLVIQTCNKDAPLLGRVHLSGGICSLFLNILTLKWVKIQ